MNLAKILIMLTLVGLCLTGKYDDLSADQLAEHSFEELFVDEESSPEQIATSFIIKMKNLFGVFIETDDLEEALTFYGNYDLSEQFSEEYRGVTSVSDAEDIFFNLLNADFKATFENLTQNFKDQGETLLDNFYDSFGKQLDGFTAFEVDYYTKNASTDLSLRPDLKRLQKFNNDSFETLKGHLQNLKDDVDSHNAFVGFLTNVFNPRKARFHKEKLNVLNRDLFQYINDRINVPIVLNNMMLTLIGEKMPNFDLANGEVFTHSLVKIISVDSYYYSQQESIGTEQTLHNLQNAYNSLINLANTASANMKSSGELNGNMEKMNAGLIGALRTLNFLKELEGDEYLSYQLLSYLKVISKRNGNQEAADALNKMFEAYPNLLAMSEGEETVALKRNLDLLMLSQGGVGVKSENVKVEGSESLATILENLLSEDSGYFNRVELGDMNIVISTDFVDAEKNPHYYFQLHQELMHEVSVDEQVTEESFTNLLDTHIDERIEAINLTSDVEHFGERRANLFIMKVINWIRGVQNDDRLTKETINFAQLPQEAIEALNNVEYQQLVSVLSNVYIKLNNKKPVGDELWVAFNDTTLDVSLMKGLVSYTIAETQSQAKAMLFKYKAKPVNMKFTEYGFDAGKISANKLDSGVNDLRDIDEEPVDPKANKNKPDKKQKNGTMPINFEEPEELDYVDPSENNKIRTEVQDQPDRKNIVNVIKGELTTSEFENLQKPELIQRLKNGENISDGDNVQVIYVQIVEAGSDCYDEILKLKNQFK